MAANLNVPVFEAADVVWDRAQFNSTAGIVAAGTTLQAIALTPGVYQYECDAGCFNGAAQILLEVTAQGAAAVVQSYLQLPNGFTSRFGLVKFVGTPADALVVIATNGILAGETVRSVLKVKRLAR